MKLLKTLISLIINVILFLYINSQTTDTSTVTTTECKEVDGICTLTDTCPSGVSIT